ncbi:hypothetical protein PCANC_00658 [Puccinia coronata f. sp. avenae]|uniref:Uncharacterized protein n=1 Tax=Puccinia coronata f. sp. avenae TaxID=200324 RepID=A0A2N5W6Y6_9BASI|nr:hypothetical protein PCASD_12323 [Puccinia coronata f. sp. avenae]PLW47754.1 hypothetical protein PCASD_04354 [Puccinia coronata f. sp. avenae]PLW57983.1 hypothetical protein PCANC_00658 [Puccinia coronata f. sp. avenae]
MASRTATQGGPRQPRRPRSNFRYFHPRTTATQHGGPRQTRRRGLYPTYPRPWTTATQHRGPGQHRRRGLYHRNFGPRTTATQRRRWGGRPWARGGDENQIERPASNRNITDQNQQEPPNVDDNQQLPVEPPVRQPDTPPHLSDHEGQQSNHLEVDHNRHSQPTPHGHPNCHVRRLPSNRRPRHNHSYFRPPSQGATRPLQPLYEYHAMDRRSVPWYQAGYDPSIPFWAHHRAPGPSTRAYYSQARQFRQLVNSNREVNAANQPPQRQSHVRPRGQAAYHRGPGHSIPGPPIAGNWLVPSYLAPATSRFLPGRQPPTVSQLGTFNPAPPFNFHPHHAQAYIAGDAYNMNVVNTSNMNVVNASDMNVVNMMHMAEVNNIYMVNWNAPESLVRGGNPQTGPFH